jgi:L-fucose mutarotase/ribose pyranase (RbsD/FucU family)
MFDDTIRNQLDANSRENTKFTGTVSGSTLTELVDKAYASAVSYYETKEVMVVLDNQVMERSRLAAFGGDPRDETRFYASFTAWQGVHPFL